MNKCEHSIYAERMAINLGMCPICLQKENDRLHRKLLLVIEAVDDFKDGMDALGYKRILRILMEDEDV